MTPVVDMAGKQFENIADITVFIKLGHFVIKIFCGNIDIMSLHFSFCIIHSKTAELPIFRTLKLP